MIKGIGTAICAGAVPQFLPHLLPKNPYATYDPKSVVLTIDGRKYSGIIDFHDEIAIIPSGTLLSFD